ncbi:MAG: CotS family spore coat protein [Clostridium sp.]|uniref:CotS family spore coat protein n=1 Tax=Clostridium sp. TaxID=1506 RepID=UPI003EE7F970
MGRYLEREFLCSYDLSKEFFDELGVEIKEVHPLRKVFILKTNMGDKILKKVYYDENKIEFIESSLKYINKTFKNTMKIDKLGNGESYLKWKGEYYILMDRITGIEATCENPLDIEICSKSIAKFHKASLGIVDYLEKENKMVIKSENLIEEYKKSLEDLKSTKVVVKGYKYPNEFDTIFLENVDKYIDEIDDVINLLENTNYENMIKDTEKIALCHNDLAHHNFLIDNYSCNIIDFDYASINLRCIDIADFILKWIKNSAFNIEVAKNILDEYSKIYNLDKEEEKIIKINLRFPKDVYSIIRVYYHKEKRWEYESYLSKLKMKIENDVYRKNFLKEYN